MPHTNTITIPAKISSKLTPSLLCFGISQLVYQGGFNESTTTEENPSNCATLNLTKIEDKEI